MREIRNHTESPATTAELQSSDVERVTTETTIASPSGEYSRHSFAQVRSSCHSASTPASNLEPKPTSTRALSRKSPPARPTRAGASSFASPVPGWTNQSDRGPATIVSESLPEAAATGVPIQRDENGSGERSTSRDYPLETRSGGAQPGDGERRRRVADVMQPPPAPRAHRPVRAPAGPGSTRAAAQQAPLRPPRARRGRRTRSGSRASVPSR